VITLIDVHINQSYKPLKVQTLSSAGDSSSPSGPSASTGAIQRSRAGQARRHSVQVTSLSKDMEKLKVGDGSSSGAGGEKSEKMSESRKKELRRLSSKRRSSKQSFLHFLDLAIAK